MMAVTISELPNEVCPNPVENDLCVCFSAPDYKTSSGVAAVLSIFVDATFINNVNGETFELFGFTFTVDDSQSHTFNTWNGTTGAQAVNIANMFNMLLQNFNFKDWTIELFDLGGGDFSIRLTACEIGEQDDFTWDFSGLTNEPALILTTTGTNPVFVDGYKIFYQLLCDEEPKDVELCPVQAVTPAVDKDGNVVLTKVDFQEELSPFVQTQLPHFDPDDDAVLDLTIKKNIQIRFGNLVANSDCGNEFQDCFTSNSFQIINTAIQANDSRGFTPYCYQSIIDTVLFLSASPRIKTICTDSFQWLYICANVQEFFEEQLLVPLNSVDYFVEVEFFLNGVSQSVEIVDFGSVDGVYIIPTGTGNPMVPEPANYDKYTVKVTYDAEITAGGNVIADLSETFCYKVATKCCIEAELIFLSEPGGYDTITFEDKPERNLIVSQNEICTDVVCQLEEDPEGYLIEGRKQINTTAFETVTLASRCYQRGEIDIDFFVQFKKSPSRFIRITDKDGNQKFRRFLIDPGGIQIFEENSLVQVRVTGRYGANRRQQSEF